MAMGDRISDLTATGIWSRTKGEPPLDLQLTSGLLDIDDLRILAAALGAMPAGSPRASPGATQSVARDTAPIWGGLSARIRLAIQRITLAQLDLREVGATVQLDPASLKIAAGKATVGAGCGVMIEGGLSFDPTAERPYGLDATVAINDFESAQLFAAIDPSRPPTIDGKFNATARLSGRYATVDEIPDRLQGEFRLASRGGLFRALRADVSESIKQTPSKMSGALGTVTSLFGVKQEAADAAGKFIDKSGKAVVELTSLISEIHYDQISATATRGPDFDIHLTGFTLIAPEERLTGTGAITYVEGAPIAGRPLSLDLQFSAQGRVAALAGSVGLTRDEKDDLGYTRLLQPIHLGGTLARIDESQLREMLIQAALRKAAGSLLDKLLGK